MRIALVSSSPRSAAALTLAALLAGCSPEPPGSTSAAASATAAVSASASATASATVAPTPIDPAVVEARTGGKPESADGVIKVSFPRDDVQVDVDAWRMPPFMGLTSWAAFTPGQKRGIEAMVMGDLVLFEDEVSDAMSAALNGGLDVTALHNHFFFDKPRVFFMHIGGEGKTEALAKGVRMALDAARAVREKTPKPGDHFDGPSIPAQSAITGAKIDAALGVKGSAKEGMYKVVIGRSATTASCGCKVGKMMGVNTWAAFAGTDDNAVVDGDFAVTEDELQPVLRALRKGGIHIVAIHHHMVGEEPRILFLHYWGRGSLDSLLQNLKLALGLTKTGGG